MSNIKKGVRLEGVSKIYLDPKTNKPFKAVDSINLNIQPGEVGKIIFIYTMAIFKSSIIHT